MPPEETGLPTGFDAQLADDADYLDLGVGPDDEHSLVDLVNRLLDKGVVITGDVVLSVAGVELVYLGLTAVLTSVSTAREVTNRRLERELPGGGG